MAGVFESEHTAQAQVEAKIEGSPRHLWIAAEAVQDALPLSPLFFGSYWSSGVQERPINRVGFYVYLDRCAARDSCKPSGLRGRHWEEERVRRQAGGADASAGDEVDISMSGKFAASSTPEITRV